MDWTSIITTITISMIFSVLGYILGKIRRSKDELKSLKHGLQALLRDRMLSLYYQAKSSGYATIEAKSNFENLYQNYHGLGLNGVMDQIYEEYMDMEVSHGLD